MPRAKVPVALDNCLGVMLGYTEDCKAGREFIHVNSDATITPCCFKDWCFLYSDEFEVRMKKLYPQERNY